MCQHLVSVVTGRQHNFPQAGGRAETCWQEGVEIPPTKPLMSEPLLQLGINSCTLGELREFELSRVPVFGLRSYLPLANEAELDQGLCHWGAGGGPKPFFSELFQHNGAALEPWVGRVT